MIIDLKSREAMRESTCEMITIRMAFEKYILLDVPFTRFCLPPMLLNCRLLIDILLSARKKL